MPASDPGPRTPPPLVPLEQYAAALPRKRMASGLLFRDPTGRVLLVEPSYKPNWELPGGTVADGESPWATATRELSEELGWDLTPGRLLVVDHVRPQGPLAEGVVFVFDGGVVEEGDLAGTVFPDGEILSTGLHTVPEVRARTKPLLADRIVAALEAIEHGGTALCEHGRRIA